MNSNLKVIGVNRVGIKPVSAAPEKGTLGTPPFALLKNTWSNPSRDQLTEHAEEKSFSE